MEAVARRQLRHEHEHEYPGNVGFTMERDALKEEGAGTGLADGEEKDAKDALVRRDVSGSPATCIMWCAIALGALMRGSPVEFVSDRWTSAKSSKADFYYFHSGLPTVYRAPTALWLCCVIFFGFLGCASSASCASIDIGVCSTHRASSTLLIQNGAQQLACDDNTLLKLLNQYFEVCFDVAYFSLTERVGQTDCHWHVHGGNVLFSVL